MAFSLPQIKILTRTIRGWKKAVTHGFSLQDAHTKPQGTLSVEQGPGSAAGPQAGGASVEGSAGADDDTTAPRLFLWLCSGREPKTTSNMTVLAALLRWGECQRCTLLCSLLRLRGTAVPPTLPCVGGNAYTFKSQVVKEAALLRLVCLFSWRTTCGRSWSRSPWTYTNTVPKQASAWKLRDLQPSDSPSGRAPVRRLTPLITSNCTSKLIPGRRHSFEPLDLLLQK